MSNNEDLNLDLDTLFQPAWAQGKIEQNLLEKFGGRDETRPRRHSGDRGNERRGPRRDGTDERRGPRRNRPGERRGGPGRFGRPVEHSAPHRETPAPLPELEVVFIPGEASVAQLAQQIKATSRAYPLFKVAQLLLDKADCYQVQLNAKKSSQSLFLCALDDSPWAKENEAVLHVLKNHLATFYQAERIPTEAPKGVYNFVAQCGMSGAVLGPPNYHDYQSKLQQLHAERFSRMPFDAFKARVKIVKDEALLKQWLEEQSFKTEYNCLNVPEPLRLVSLEEVNKHFRTTHKDYIIKRVDSCTIPGPFSRRLPCDGIQRLIRREWDQLQRSPLPFATKLSQQLARHGLQFFKVNKTITHVNVARPKFLDLAAEPVSDGIKRIVEYINANKKCSRKKLLHALAPAPKPQAADTPILATPAPTTDTTTQAPATQKPVTSPELSPEQQAVLMDLHWLVHQGFVLEFANGHIETAKKPAAPAKKQEAVKKPEPALASPNEPQQVEAKAPPAVDSDIGRIE
jgi:hypothetical protein